MAEKIYGKTEIVGTSTQGYDAAIKGAVDHARKTLKGLSWFEVVEQRGNLSGPEITYQVTIRVGHSAE